MYIPGVNYNRRTYGEAQEDITRFGRMAAAAGEGAVAAAELAGLEAGVAFNQTNYDLQLKHTLENTSLSQEAFALQNKWAAFEAVGNLASTLLTDVITPIYNQKVANQKASSDRVYKYHMEALDLKISNEKTRMEEGPDGIMHEVSNADRLHEAFVTGHGEAMQEASKGITIPELQRAQDQTWADNKIAGVGAANKLQYEWEKEQAKSDWASEYDIMGSQFKFNEMEFSLEQAKANQTITAGEYTKNLIALRGSREQHEVDLQITAISGTENLQDFVDRADALEARLRDTNELTTMAGAATNTAIGKLNTVRSQRATEAKNQAASIKAGVDFIDDAVKTRLIADRDILKQAFGDELLADELLSIDLHLKAAQATITQRFGGTDEYNKQQVKVADALVERYGAMTDMQLNRSGGADVDAFTSFRTYVLGATPADLGFGLVDSPTEYKTKLLNKMDEMTKHHKDQIIADGELSIVRNQTALMDSGQWGGSVGGTFYRETLGFKSEKTEAEFLNDYYSSKVAGFDERIEAGENEVELIRELDQTIIFNAGDQLPSLLKEDITAGLSNANPAVAIASADRLANMRVMTSRELALSGRQASDDIYNKLTDTQASVVDFYDTTQIINGTMTESQQEDFVASLAYQTTTAPAQLQIDKEMTRKAYNNDEKVANLLTETMTTLGYSEDAIDKLETREDYANLRNMTQIYVEKYSGMYLPSIAAHKAARETLRYAGITDRPIDQTLPGNLESAINGGMPLPGMAADFDQWQKRLGVSEAFEDSGIIEIVRPAMNDDMTPKLDNQGNQLREAWYATRDGQMLEDNNGDPLVYTPDPYNFDTSIKSRKDAAREGNKLVQEQGRKALAFIYEEYPHMEDDFWNPNGRNYTGMPFEELSPGVAEDFALSRSKDILPSGWWTNYDPNQATARKLSNKEENYIITQIGNKFDLYLEEHPTLSDGGLTDILNMRTQATKAAIWNAQHNTKGYPGYTPDAFEKLYPDADTVDIPRLMFSN